MVTVSAAGAVNSQRLRRESGSAQRNAGCCACPAASTAAPAAAALQALRGTASAQRSPLPARSTRSAWSAWSGSAPRHAGCCTPAAATRACAASAAPPPRAGHGVPHAAAAGLQPRRRQHAQPGRSRSCGGCRVLAMRAACDAGNACWVWPHSPPPVAAALAPPTQPPAPPASAYPGAGGGLLRSPQRRRQRLSWPRPDRRAAADHGRHAPCVRTAAAREAVCSRRPARSRSAVAPPRDAGRYATRSGVSRHQPGCRQPRARAGAPKRCTPALGAATRLPCHAAWPPRRRLVAVWALTTTQAVASRRLRRSTQHAPRFLGAVAAAAQRRFNSAALPGSTPDAGWPRSRPEPNVF